MAKAKKQESSPQVYVLTRVYCKPDCDVAQFLKALKSALESIKCNGYDGEVISLIYDDTCAPDEKYIDERNKMLEAVFKNGNNKRCEVINPENQCSSGSAYALYKLRESFLQKAQDNRAVAIILDQDDKLQPGAIKNIVSNMPNDGIVVSPFRVIDEEGLDITDDGGRFHNTLSRFMRFKWFRVFIEKQKWATAPIKYKKVFFPFSGSELKAVCKTIWYNIGRFFLHYWHRFLNHFIPRIGLSDLSSIGWTKSYSREAMEKYHSALADLIKNNVSLTIDESGNNPESAKITKFFKELDAYEDFIDFYVLLLKDVPISGILTVSHNYFKHPDSITSTPKLEDFSIKRTNSLLTLIDLCYATAKANSSALRTDFKRLLHRFVASKSYQITTILKKYCSDYNEYGKKQYAEFAAMVHEEYFVNKLSRLGSGEDRNINQDKLLFEHKFTRTENTAKNFTDLFCKDTYESIAEYKTKLTAHSPRNILLSSMKQEGELRNTRKKTAKVNSRVTISSHRKSQLRMTRIFLILATAVFIGIVCLSYTKPQYVNQNAALLAFLGVAFTILVKELGRIRTSIEEDSSTLKLYYSEFIDLTRHLEANMKVLLAIRKEAVGENTSEVSDKQVKAQNIHFDNLKWPLTSVLFSDEMAKLMPREKVEDFTRLKVNIRNINNSAQWLTELATKGELTVSELDWELSRCFGYLINLYYMECHDFRFATQNELDNYIHDNFIRYKLTMLFMDYRSDKRYEMVEYFITRYYNDRRMKRAVLVKTTHDHPLEHPRSESVSQASSMAN